MNHLSQSIENSRLKAAEEDFERRSEQEKKSNKSVSEEIDRFIEENGNNTRDALNVALTRLQLLELKVQHFEDGCEQEFEF